MELKKDKNKADLIGVRMDKNNAQIVYECSYCFIQKLVKTVVRNALQQEYKADDAIKFTKHTAFVFRTEE